MAILIVQKTRFRKVYQLIVTVPLISANVLLALVTYQKVMLFSKQVYFYFFLYLQSELTSGSWRARSQHWLGEMFWQIGYLCTGLAVFLIPGIFKTRPFLRHFLDFFATDSIFLWPIVLFKVENVEWNYLWTMVYWLQTYQKWCRVAKKMFK